MLPALPSNRPRPPYFCEYCDKAEERGKHKLRFCSGCNWVKYCDQSCQVKDYAAHYRFCVYARGRENIDLRDLSNRDVVPACGIGSVNYRFAQYAYQRLLRYELIPKGERSLRIAAKRPLSLEAEKVRTMFRRLAGFPTYDPIKANRILIQGNIDLNERTRQDPFNLIKPFTMVAYDPDQEAGLLPRAWTPIDDKCLFSHSSAIHTVFDTGTNRTIVHPESNIADMCNGPTAHLSGISPETVKIRKKATFHWQTIPGQGEATSFLLPDSLVADGTPYSLVSPGILDNKQVMQPYFRTIRPSFFTTR